MDGATARIDVVHGNKQPQLKLPLIDPERDLTLTSQELTYRIYEDCGFHLDSGWDWIDDIVAWMPLPKPWKGAEAEG